MPKARKSSPIRRQIRFREKYQHRTVPLRYKVYLPRMEELLKPELPRYVDLEQPIMDECQSKGVPTDQWQYYIGFGKRAKEICMTFSSETKAEELEILQDEYILRGHDPNVLSQIKGIVDPWILGVSMLEIDTRLG